MDIVLSNASPKAIYEQIVDQIQAAIMAGRLRAGERLPSIRTLASELEVSVITTKRAYSELERAGLIETAEGRGSFVSAASTKLAHELHLKTCEDLALDLARNAQVAQLSLDDVIEMVHDAVEFLSSEEQDSAPSQQSEVDYEHAGN